MQRTREILGSDIVEALFGEPPQYLKGEWEDVIILDYQNHTIPGEIQQAVIGLHVPTIFTIHSLSEQLPDGSLNEQLLAFPSQARLAYVGDVEEVLRLAGKVEVADQLHGLFSPLDMYVIDRRAYDPHVHNFYSSGGTLDRWQQFGRGGPPPNPNIKY